MSYPVPPTPLEPVVGVAVIKNGRATQATVGVITTLSVAGVRVKYRPRIAIFYDEIMVRGVDAAPFSALVAILVR